MFFLCFLFSLLFLFFRIKNSFQKQQTNKPCVYFLKLFYVLKNKEYKENRENKFVS